MLVRRSEREYMSSTGSGSGRMNVYSKTNVRRHAVGRTLQLALWCTGGNIGGPCGLLLLLERLAVGQQ
jgi:hypothetical protein